MQTDDLIAAARSYLGVRWVHQGRNRMGVDCIGLVVCSLADIGCPVEDKVGYRRDPEPESFLHQIRKETIPAINPAPGMLGVFRSALQPCHVGIFAEMHGQLSFIHAFASQRVVMEEPFAHHWPKLLMQVRQFKGIEY